MRLSTKLVLGLGVTSAIALGTYGVHDFRRKDRDLRRTAEHHLNLLGTALQIAIEHSLRDGQEADIQEVLAGLEQRDPSVDVSVFDTEGQLMTGSPGSEGTLDLVRRVVREAGDGDQAFLRFEGLSYLVGAFPLHDDNRSRLGTIAVAKPLDALRRELLATAAASAITSLSLIAGINAISWLLVRFHVTRPLSSLAQGMRAVRAGDLTANVATLRADEVGALAAEFNAMVRDLEEARRQLLAAAEARRTLEAALRHIDKLVTVGQLSAGLAHEIGSPLQIVSGRARSLAGRTDLPPDAARAARILEEQSDRIARIVEQLLSFARRKAPHMGEVDMRATVGVIVDLLEPDARRRGLRLELDCAAALPKVTADADQVQQVAMNLLSNALRATPREGRVRVALSPSSIGTPDGEGARPAVRLVVEDTGAGMPADVLSHAFEPFFTTWAANGGTGLGLAVVKSIVDAHGGAIRISSQHGAGTRCLVDFPVLGLIRAGGSVA